MGEVNYFSSKIIVERNIESPTILIPSIGVNEKINNISLNQGVLSDPGENLPSKDPVVLYGHRTLQGSPFLRLNELSAGDTLLLEWPGIGELNYTVKSNEIKSIEDKRRRSLEGLFGINPKLSGIQQDLKDKHIVIFDDNISSGATLDDICLELQKYGVASILPITLAIIPKTVYGQEHESLKNK
mgnify:CR=1 FL=1